MKTFFKILLSVSLLLAVLALAGGFAIWQELASHPEVQISVNGETLPLHELVEAVPSLMHLAPGLFRSKLMALSAKPERWFRLSIRNETQAGGDLAAGSALSPASAADGARTLPAGHCHAPDDDRHHPHPYPHPPHGPGCRSALKCPVMTTTTATRRRPRCRRSSRTSSN